jgi:hypothetical protein
MPPAATWWQQLIRRMALSIAAMNEMMGLNDENEMMSGMAMTATVVT